MAAKLYATLFSGPPMSKAIIRPRITPSRIALLPLMEFRPSVSWVISQKIGLPSTVIISTPAMTEASSGMTSTGIRPRAQVGTFQPATQWATSPARTPPTMAPRKPVAGNAAALSPVDWTLNRLAARPPSTKPGAMPGRSAIA